MRGTRLDAAYRFAMFQTGLPLLKISMLLEILDFLAEWRPEISPSGSKGSFHIRTHPAPGCQLGCGIAGKENKVFVVSAGRPGCGIKTSAIDNRSSTFWRARI
jgi:hypothetical protein